MMQPIQRTVLAPFAFELLQGLNVAWGFALLGAIPAANMRRQERLSVDDADSIEGGNDSEGALSELVGNRIVIQVVASVGSFADFDIDALVTRKFIVWK